MEKRIKTFKEYKDEYLKSKHNPESFWEEKAHDFEWKKKWKNVLSWDFEKPEVKWFEEGKLNITENCLDRHVKSQAQKTAITWISNNPNEKNKYLSYEDLHNKVCQFCNVLKANNIQKGDRVCIYMPMVPELAIAILSCARIGAIHSVVFAGFSEKSLADRINDAKCKILITSDGSYRGNKVIPLKEIADVAMSSTPSIKSCIVLKRTGININMKTTRDKWWHDEIKNKSVKFKAEEMDSEDTLFILYTSGSTGQPKGIQHSTAGYMIYTEYTFRNIFQYSSNDVYWCTADIGWITGHSYIIYGPLLCGANTVMFEGIPSYPDYGRFWKIIEENKINIFYTAPTAIRSLASHGEKFVKPYNLSSLKVLGTVGEPINEEAWNWYNKTIGKENCPIVDTWWQTETGGIMISNFAGVTPAKPTFATLPVPGIFPCILDENGKEIKDHNKGGNLCIKFPWPSMARSIHGNHKRFKEVYFKKFKKHYFSGDGCYRDEKGMYRITGRKDDIIIVSGHNLGTAEIENCINQHSRVFETAVVGIPHQIKGNSIFAFVVANVSKKKELETTKEINKLLRQDIGPIAKIDQIQFVKELPKTRSGKIMRRILKNIASGNSDELGDISTLLNSQVVEDIKKRAL